jgi:hypothetical protein
VEDLVGATGNIREAVEIFTGIVHYWAANPSRDVATALPKLRGVTKDLATIVNTLEQQIIPREICASCDGRGRNCAACGGGGWLPSSPPSVKKGASKKATQSKTTSSTKATKGKATPTKAATARPRNAKSRMRR